MSAIDLIKSSDMIPFEEFHSLCFVSLHHNTYASFASDAEHNLKLICFERTPPLQWLDFINVSFLKEYFSVCFHV